MRNLLKYYKNIITKACLSIGILTSVFVFNASAENIRPQHEQIAQTESVVAGKNKSQKRIISYKKLFQQLAKNKYFSVFLCSGFYAVKMLDNLTSLKYNKTTELFNSYKALFLSSLLIKLPQHSTEDLISC